MEKPILLGIEDVNDTEIDPVESIASAMAAAADQGLQKSAYGPLGWPECTDVGEYTCFRTESACLFEGSTAGPQTFPLDFGHQVCVEYMQMIPHAPKAPPIGKTMCKDVVSPQQANQNYTHEVSDIIEHGYPEHREKMTLAEVTAGPASALVSTPGPATPPPSAYQPQAPYYQQQGLGAYQVNPQQSQFYPQQGAYQQQATYYNQGAWPGYGQGQWPQYNQGQWQGYSQGQQGYPQGQWPQYNQGQWPAYNQGQPYYSSGQQQPPPPSCQRPPSATSVPPQGQPPPPTMVPPPPPPPSTLSTSNPNGPGFDLCIPGLFVLAWCMVILIGFKKFCSFTKGAKELQMPLMSAKWESRNCNGDYDEIYRPCENQDNHRRPVRVPGW
eukprot:gnl/MRDRNA2_/MRDRNA2_31802_c0_seq1.p1 gnl/MRDRNA2_/MRDRNA2_31802_c0~~gnl/MRDRNA2_/MRDRNA2_31802_c0_seq1.p1  ORF type:complete len:430 (-),score=71.49 gnl/MRDRNA2_/MRDRNA2_31802_c0_seq1:127-1275(-)